MHSKNLMKLLVIVGFFGVVPFVAAAESVVRTGETVSIDSDQRIEGDFYGAASIVNLSGEVSEDMSLVGGKITLNGKVGKDALLVGGNVDVHGAVGEDVRIIGGDVIIAEPITGDVFVIARSVTILDTASIGGDLVVYASEVEISGSIGGDVAGQIESLRLDAPVKSSVDVTTMSFVVGDRADIGGGIQYTSVEALTRAPGAKVAGQVTRNDPSAEDNSDVGVRAVAVPVLMVLFAALAWYLIARTLLTKIIDRALVRGIRPFATGFVMFFAAPVIIVVLIMSVLGTVVGITALVAYLFAILLAFLSIAPVLGQVVFQLVKKEKIPLSPLGVVTGVAVAVILAIIPVFGIALLFGLFLITLGALVDLVLHP
jgi:hypothetical protein